MRGCACRGTAGFAHVSCLAEQAKILFEEAEANNLDWEVKNPRWSRWHTCSLCEQDYHGVVRHALGWACWKTHAGRPEQDQVRRMAMTQLANGLTLAKHHEDALSVQEAELSLTRRHGANEEAILITQNNLAMTYGALGRDEEALRLKLDVYSGRLKLHGEEHPQTLIAASNYSASLFHLQRIEEAKALLRKVTPVTRRVLGDNHDITLKMRFGYAASICFDAGSTLDDLRGAVTTLEETARTARRVLGGTHPITTIIEGDVRLMRLTLRARETPSPGSS